MIAFASDYRQLPLAFGADEKRCSKCGETKPREEFCKDTKRRDGLYPQCKECTRKWHQRHYQENKEAIDERNRTWHKQNKDKHALRVRRYYDENRERLSLAARERRQILRKANPEAARTKDREKAKKLRDASPEKYREAARRRYRLNQEKSRARQRLYYLKNSESVIAYQRKYRKTNPEKIQSRLRRYINENRDKIREYRQKPLVRMCNALRTRQRALFRGKVRRGSMVRDMGCTSEFLRSHVEGQLSGPMTLENYGNVWHLDHIYPLSKADLTDRVQFLAVANWRNLRPMLAVENLAKSDTVTPEAQALFDALCQEFAGADESNKQAAGCSGGWFDG